MRIFILGSFLIVGIVGCHFPPNINHPPRTVYDTVKVEVVSGEVQPVAGNRQAVKRIELSRIGQVAKFYQGEAIEIFFNGIDINNSTVQTTTNPETNEVILSIVDLNNSVVTLSNKCDVIEWKSVKQLPRIEVASNLRPEQIVITPLFDDNCNRTGYQIRYGSIERGCNQQAAVALRRFNKCTGTHPPPPPPPPPCMEYILFGTPCP